MVHLYLTESLEDVVWVITFAPDEPHNEGPSFIDSATHLRRLHGCSYSFHRFLGKFGILDKIKWMEELINDSIRTVCEDFIYSGTDYTWMRFSVNEYMTYLDWYHKDAILFIKQAFERHAAGRVRLILSVKYKSQRTSQRQVASLVEDPDVADVIQLTSITHPN